MIRRSVRGLCGKLEGMQDGNFCPECGGRMTETERCRENDCLFVWYVCSQDDCDGQWLRKYRYDPKPVFA
jgi:hypothetical protein